jgi:hypothetical protein
MAKQIINTGISANDGTGDNLRTGGAKVNDNFNEIYNILGDGSSLLNNDIDFGPNKLLFSNKVSSVTDLNSINANGYAGLIIQVEQTGALYYAYSGTWKRLLSDTSSGTIPNYTDPLSSIAYSGDYNELINRPSVPTSITDLSDITDGSAGQVLTTDGVGNFIFRDITATNVTFAAITGKPTTTSGYGIIDAFSGNYDDLTNKPVIFSGNYNDLTNQPSIATDISGLTDTTNLLFSKNYLDLTGKPAIPNDINDLADSDNLLFSGSYTDLTNKPTLFTGLSSIGLSLGVNIDEFSNDTTLVGSSSTSVPTENAVKTYVDNAISNFTAFDQDLNSTDSVEFLAVNAGTITTTNNIKFTSSTIKGIGLADDSVRLLMYGTDSGIGGTKATINANFEVTGDVTATAFNGDGSGLTGLPNVLTDLGIVDGTAGEVLTTNGAGGFTFQAPSNTGNFTLAASVIDTDDSSAITITPSVVISSDLTVENDLTVNGNINSTATGTPELYSETNVLITTNDGVSTWNFGTDGNLTFPDATVQTTAYTDYHTGDMTGSVFADNSTLLVDAVNGTIPGYISIASLKAEVAASTDFADFKSRIAAL